MSNQPQTPEKSDSEDFAKQAEEPQIGLVAEFVEFVVHNKKWWLTPIILVLILFGLFMVLGNAAAPFIYPLF
jgi:hypothetical protein